MQCWNLKRHLCWNVWYQSIYLSMRGRCNNCTSYQGRRGTRTKMAFNWWFHTFIMIFSLLILSKFLNIQQHMIKTTEVLTCLSWCRTQCDVDVINLVLQALVFHLYHSLKTAICTNFADSIFSHIMQPPIPHMYSIHFIHCTVTWNVGNSNDKSFTEQKCRSFKFWFSNRILNWLPNYTKVDRRYKRKKRESTFDVLRHGCVIKNLWV